MGNTGTTIIEINMQERRMSVELLFKIGKW